RRTRRRAVLGCLPRGDRAVLLHAARALARAMSALGIGRGHGAAPIGQPWLWTLAFWQHEDRTPTHGYADDARGRDGGFRQKVVAGAVLRSGGRSAFGGKAENICSF